MLCIEFNLMNLIYIINDFIQIENFKNMKYILLRLPGIFMSGKNQMEYCQNYYRYFPSY